MSFELFRHREVRTKIKATEEIFHRLRVFAFISARFLNFCVFLSYTPVFSARFCAFLFFQQFLRHFCYLQIFTVALTLDWRIPCLPQHNRLRKTLHSYSQHLCSGGQAFVLRQLCRYHIYKRVVVILHHNIQVGHGPEHSIPLSS